MIRTLVVVFVLGVGLASGQACVTDADVTAVNGSVTAISSDPTLMAILTNTALTEGQRMFMILNTTCYTPSVRTEADKIDMKIRACPALINVTTVGTLQLGSLQFAMLFTAFSSMDNFCDCFPAMLQAQGLAQVAPNFLMNIQNGEYENVINVPTLCSETAEFSVPEAVQLVSSKMTECPILVPTINSSTINGANLLKMTAFIKKGLCDLKGVNYTCMMMESASTDFKYCMAPSQIGTDVTASEPSKRPSCKRQQCIRDNLDAPCNVNTSTVYAWSAAMYGEDVEVTGDCSGAMAVAIASFLLVAAASLVSVLMK